MKNQNLFSGKNKEIFQNFYLLNFLPSVLSVKDECLMIILG